MRALDIYGKLFNFIVEFYCLIILCVKNLGVFCDLHFVEFLFATLRSEVPLYLTDVRSGHIASPLTEGAL